MTIDRAIEILNPEHRECYKDLEEVNEACRMGMEALERSKWIPCSERLPKSYDEVLIWDSLDNVHYLGFYANANGWVVDGYEDDRYSFDITHWMPLPEPPEDI